MATAKYLRIAPGMMLPSMEPFAPFRAVVISDLAVSLDWQTAVSQWLVQSGCLYAMTWGANCSSWHDSIDMANIEQFNFNEIPDDKFVMTTWHENETLSEVFWFCREQAFHPTVAVTNSLLLHISEDEQQQKMFCLYADAK